MWKEIGKIVGEAMNEKLYKVVHMAGAGSIAIGIIMIVTGIVTGILSIVAGAHLLKEKKNIII